VLVANPFSISVTRYSLPQHVRFVDDKLKRVYTQDLLEGIENMNIITGDLFTFRSGFENDIESKEKQLVL
jgi:hypothetical protein